VRDCPKCGLANPATAERCDCGYSFASGTKDGAGDPALAEERARKQRRAYIAGVLGFSIMTIQGLVSTLNPKPDGRLLNTAPSLGVDVFLFVGLLGIVFCVVQVVRLR
jgi:hypothetical protein